jgi:hypothetical protein
MTGSVAAFTLSFKFLYLDKSMTCSVSDPWIYGMSNKWNGGKKEKKTVEIGYNDLGLCDTSFRGTQWWTVLYGLQRYIFNGTNEFPIRHVFLCLYEIHKSIYLGYNDIASHRFQHNFLRSSLFWEFYHILVLWEGSGIDFPLSTSVYRHYLLTKYPYSYSSLSYRRCITFSTDRAVSETKH